MKTQYVVVRVTGIENSLPSFKARVLMRTVFALVFKVVARMHERPRVDSISQQKSIVYKFLAVFMSLILIFSFLNISVFSDIAEAEDRTPDTSLVNESEEGSSDESASLADATIDAEPEANATSTYYDLSVSEDVDALISDNDLVSEGSDSGDQTKGISLKAATASGIQVEVFGTEEALEEGSSINLIEPAKSGISERINAYIDPKYSIEDMLAVDISILGSDRLEYEPSKPVGVRVSNLPAAFEADRLFHINDVGDVINVSFLAKDGAIEFAATEFSPYVFVALGTPDSDQVATEDAVVESANARVAQYAITFNANGGSGSVPAAMRASAGSLVQLPQNPFTYTNHEFMGWSTVKNAGLTEAGKDANTVYSAGSYFTMPEGNVTLYANWATTKGSKDVCLVVAVNKTETIPAEPGVFEFPKDKIVYLHTYGEKPNFRTVNLLDYVKRAYTTKNADEVAALLTDKFYSDVAKWNRDKNYSGWNPNTQEVKWYVIKEQKNDTTAYPGVSPITWHIDGIVVPKAQKVTLDYSTNCDDLNVVRPAGGVYAKNSQVKVAEAIERSDYQFLGWTEQKDWNGDEGKLIQPDSSYKLTKNTTLYAQWRINDVTLNYVAVGHGRVDPTSEKLNPVEGAANGSKATANDGYELAGWYGNSELKGDPLSKDPDFRPTKAQNAHWVDGTTYYAKFVEREDLSYTVSHYIRSTNAGDKLVQTYKFENAKFGSTVEAEGKKIVIPGYRFESARPSSIAIGTDESKNHMDLYYAADFSNVGMNSIDKVYDGVESKLVPSGILSTDKLTYYRGTLEQYQAGYLGDDDVIENGFTNVVDTPIVMVVKRGDDSYAVGTNVKIGQRPVRVFANDASYVYDSGSDKVNYAGASIELQNDAEARGLIVGDLLNMSEAGSNDIALSPAKDIAEYVVGDHPNNVIASIERENENANYAIEYVPGKLVVSKAGGNAITAFNLADAEGLTKVYNANPSGVSAIASVEGSTIWYSLDEVDWSESSPQFVNFGSYTVYAKATKPNYEDTPVVSAVVSITPAPVVIEVRDESKLVGTEDPIFDGEVKGLLGTDTIGNVSYFRNNGDEAVGVYPEAIDATFDGNELGNYSVSVKRGTLTITAPAVVPVTPPTPVPPVPGTPVIPIVPAALAGTPAAGIAFIPDDATPLAGEEAIADEENPLTVFDSTPECWVHFWIMIGMFISAVYGIGALLRRNAFANKLLRLQESVLSGESQSKSGSPRERVAKERNLA